ncbi:MAG: hypothetical protein R2821_09835 [Flavobacteriaceae bacterium]|jgi:hypothetical protein|nr:hypothetical protein [Flavobacteriaceae bacterium]MCB0486119.1 hypothetical protein [Flavobacteriaceae bacterium]
MEKLYFKELLNEEQLNPKKETISFLLNYSKSIGVVRNKKDKPVMFHLN